MKRTISEAAALKKLDIPDFRHLTKDKVSQFVSLLPQMPPEVQKKALEQFPNFAKTVSGAVAEYKEIVLGVISSNDRSMESYRAEALSIINALEKLLERDDLSFEDKKYVTETLLKVHQMSHEKDSENKKFNWALVGASAAFLASAVAALASALGGNSKTDPPKTL